MWWYDFTIPWWAVGLVMVVLCLAAAAKFLGSSN